MFLSLLSVASFPLVHDAIHAYEMTAAFPFTQKSTLQTCVRLNSIWIDSTHLAKVLNWFNFWLKWLPQELNQFDSWLKVFQGKDSNHLLTQAKNMWFWIDSWMNSEWYEYSKLVWLYLHSNYLLKAKSIWMESYSIKIISYPSDRSNVFPFNSRISPRISSTHQSRLFPGINSIQLMTQAISKNIDSNQLRLTRKKTFNSNQLMNKLWATLKCATLTSVYS